MYILNFYQQGVSFCDHILLIDRDFYIRYLCKLVDAAIAHIIAENKLCIIIFENK